MQTSVEDHVIYQVANAPVRLHPFPHVYIESVFPADFYAELRRNWPSAEHLVSLESTGRVTKGAYTERFIMPLHDKQIAALPDEKRAFWSELAGWMLGSSRFLFTVMDKFNAPLRTRFGSAFDPREFAHEILVVRDHSNYSLGPHTDSPRKAVSVLFYCPDDERYAHLGTSIYAPVDPAFRCEGGPHYPFDRFRKVATMPYRPNALFAFVKTDNSFHGVDPIRDADVLRDLFLYDIQVDTAPPRAAADAELSETPASPRDCGPAAGSLGVRMLKNILRRRR